MSIMQTLMTSTLNNAGGPSATLIMSLPADGYSGSGTTWADYSGNGYNATLVNGPAYTNTVPRYFTLNPNNLQYVQGPDIGNRSNWSVETWFRVTATLSNYTCPAVFTTTYAEASGNFYGHVNYCLTNYNNNDSGNPDNILRAGFYNGSWHQTSGFTPSLNTWYHVVCTYDGATLAQWVNGSSNSSTYVGEGSISNGGPLRIGRRWDGAASSEFYFPGDIAVVKIYDGVLTSSQITTEWNATKSDYGL